MIFSVKTTTSAFFILLFIIGSGNFATLLISENNAETKEQWVDHTHQVLNEASLLLGHLRDMEIGQRGFLLTLNEDYLEPYNSGKKESLVSLERLYKLTSDNLKQQDRLSKIEKLIVNKFNELHETINLARQGKLNESMAIVNSDVGKIIMDKIRVIKKDFTAEERILLTKRKNEFHEVNQAISTWYISIGLLMIIITVFGAIVIQKQLVKPLMLLTAETIKFGKGKRLNFQSSSSSSYELIKLTEAFKEMYTKIQDKSDNEALYREDLENVVDEKTKDLKSAVIEAEKANAEKSRFLANMSHELRTPMHAIESFTNLALKIVSDDKSKRYLNNISTSAERLTRLLNDLLDLAKLESGKMNLDFTKQSLTKVVQTHIEEIESLCTDKELSIVFDNSKSFEGTFDQHLIGQVITNLLSNAIKFSPIGSIIKISLNSQTTMLQGHNQSILELSVIDQGIGIPKDELDIVFDKFIQSSKTMTDSGGTGLGLPICKEIIMAHKGAIWAASSNDNESRLADDSNFFGTAFYVRIPVTQVIEK